MGAQSTEQNLTPTPASQWQGKLEVAGADVLLPSGNVARVKQISPQAFLSSGLIPDPLSNIIRQAVHTKKGLPPKKMQEIGDDPALLESALELFDRVLSFIMVQPEIMMPPPCTECGEYYNVDARHSDTKHEDYHRYQEGAREADVLYADVVAMDDKVFLFNWAIGGTRDLEAFRQEQQELLGTLSDSEDVPRTAKRTARRK